MDDLLGEDWQASTNQTKNRIASNGALSSNYSSFRPSPQQPASTTSTPLNLSRPSSTVTGGLARPSSTTPKPVVDVFGSLVGTKSAKPASTANLSIQERQKQLAEEKRRQLEEQGKLWDSLGSGKANTAIQQAQLEDVDDILAAFNRDAKVDNASHFPPPTSSVSASSGRGTPFGSHQLPSENTFIDDDDTFGLNTLASKTTVPAATARTTEDDILGDLGRPVQPRVRQKEEDSSDSDEGWNENVAKSRARDAVEIPQDGPLAELVEMGFPADSARTALDRNDGDTQRAVGWLLQQAHEESKSKMREQQGLETDRQRSPLRNGSGQAHGRGRNGASSAHRDQSNDSRIQTPSGGKDAAQVAQELGNKLFKSANSLWKASQKQMAKTMSEFQQERDPTQPKWMSSADSSRDGSQRPTRRTNGQGAVSQTDLTNEAALLDMPRTELPVRPSKTSKVSPPDIGQSNSPSQFRDADSTSRSTPRSQDWKPVNKLTRDAVEEQSAQAYVSPARRRRATPQPQTQPAPEPEVDLFSPEPVKKNVPAANTEQRRPAVLSTPRPAAQTRSIPPVSATALTTSAGHRKRGTEAFKRGDYALAHEAYTAALTPLPPTHPVLILVLSNRSLTALKTGDAKTAVSDAERALELIGPGMGSGETIEAEGEQKSMREFYGKALMRKAEALEHLEKWNDAGAVWRLAVETGVGGAVSIRGKERCDRAVAPKPVVAPKPAAAPIRAKPVPKSSSQASTEAVRKLREANAAAEKADDEKFQLADQVDARLTTWKGGKADNLRALLQSLDTVLWSSAGWKKVGMSDLVVAGKVKIVYMKAIAKVHPDKIAQDASTEERMISGAVFSTLNEAWDKFKKDNNL